MTVTVSNEIVCKDPTDELKSWCKKNLVIPNPDYLKKQRMGKWLGKTPKNLQLYSEVGDHYILPYGVLNQIRSILGEYTVMFPDKRNIEYHADVPLYDYQQTAVDAMLNNDFGVLQSKAGSGKTQMGIAIIGKLGCRALWLTHTHDLLQQSEKRAAQYMDSALFGEITEGKVSIGKGLTFATVQTFAKIDYRIYQNEFDCVIVDECHRVAGTPTAATQFGMVLSNLNCRHKYGLSATVHRADGLIKTMFAYLGDIAYTVPDEAVADKVMTVSVVRRPTHTEICDECLDTDGTLLYQNLITYLTRNTRRNFLISNDLANNAEHFNLILSDRIDHLKTLMSMLPAEMCVMIDGSMTSKSGKAAREQALEDMRTGTKHYLFATYRLAKEGLDVPRMDRLYLTTPQKDYAVIVQAVGRIARVFDGKPDPIVFDYVDSIDYLMGSYKKRCSHYRKSGCLLIGGVYE